MAKYSKLFITTHLSYWYIYLISILFILFASIVTLISIPFSLAVLTSDKNAHIMSALVFTIISSFLLLLPNYKVARNYDVSTNGIVVIIVTLCNHLIFAIPIFITVYMFLRSFISEFS
jgi:hypothetical protein